MKEQIRAWAATTADEEMTKGNYIDQLIAAKIEADEAKARYDKMREYVLANDNWFDNGKIERHGITIKLQSKSGWVVNENVSPLEVIKISPKLVKIDASKLAKINPEMCHKEPLSSSLVFEGIGKAMS